MLKIGTATCPTFRLALFLALTLLYVTGCGIGLDTEARLQRMQQAFAEGEYRAAVIDAKNVLQEQPDNVAARLVLGRASVVLGDGASAEQELRNALELGASINLVIVDLGQSLLMQQKFEQVIAEMTPDLATTDADRLQVIRMRGDALLGMGQPIAARESYMLVLAANGDDSAAHLGVVNSYITEPDYLRARDTLDQLLSFDDNYVPAWLTSGSLSMLLRNAERAADDYERAAMLARNQSDDVREMLALSGFASAVIAQSKVDDARSVLDRMIELAPQDTRTLLASARVAIVDENWTQAQRYLQEILRRVQDHRPAQLLLGIVHKESGNLGQAEMYFAAVVAAAPDDANARQLLAVTRLELHKADEARQALEPIVRNPLADAGSLAMAARASFRLGDFDDAATLLRRSVAAEPDNMDLQIRLIFTYLRSGNSDDALDQARATLARWPERAVAHGLVGSISASIGDFSTARSSFNESGRLAPDDVRPIRYLAQLDELDGDHGSARDRYLSILELQPGDASAMVALARLAARNEAPDEVREWLEKARGANASAIAPRAILGSMYVAARDFAAAEVVVKEAINLDQGNAKLHNILGLSQLNQDDYGSATISFEQAMRLDPDEPSYRLNMARAQAKRGDGATALLTLQESTDQDLQHIPSAVLLASLKADAGDLEGARKIAKQLRDTYPDEATPHALEAELLARGGNLRGASAAYDRALSIQNSQSYAIRAYQIRNQAERPDQVAPLVAYLHERPLDVNMKIYLAQAYQGLHEFSNASAQYEQVLSTDSDNIVAANNLAWIYFEVGDPRAEEVARRAYEIRPDNGAVVDTLGWILVTRGEFRDGIAMLRNAVELDDSRPEILYHLAAALVVAGETAEAKSVLQELLATEAEFASRQEAEDLLPTL